ncbi:uncharacterized protein [Triticum aestivum]|uniref:uncharacterized protein n=1 Tax=Triticum aestivum TaxID=4565 RepID=UPI001D024F1B|nr:uncharacterized protein LOC123069891 [Triticum aestivum]
MSAVRSKCSGGQYGEAQRPLGLREVQGRKQPIRRAVPVRRPYGLRGVLDLAPTPPTRAGHPPVRRPHPHHQAPQQRPRLPVASEDFQINTEAPCVHSVLPSTILQPERGLRTFSKTGTL